MILFRKFLILTLFLGLPLVASAQADDLDIPDYVHLFLGEEEMWIPNYPRITGSGPHPPKRAHFGMGIEIVSRLDSQGGPIRFYPLITPPPYDVDSVMISSSGRDRRGLHEILGSNGELDQLKGIRNILAYRVYETGLGLRRLNENAEAVPSPYPDFTLLGPQRWEMESFRTTELQIFGQYLTGHCAQLSPREPEGYFCTLNGRLPNSARVRIKFRVNYQGQESWEHFDVASETWPARLAALERLILSFYETPHQ